MDGSKILIFASSKRRCVADHPLPPALAAAAVEHIKQTMPDYISFSTSSIDHRHSHAHVHYNESKERLQLPNDDQVFGYAVINCAMLRHE